MKLFDKCFRSIDEIPIYNWNKIHETGDYKFLFRDKFKVRPEYVKALVRRWKKLYDEYLKRFGFGDHFLEILELKKKVALMKIEMCETGNGTIQTLIELEQIAIEKKQQRSGSGNFHQIKGYLQKYMGFQIDERKMTVLDFYSNLKLMENERSPRGH